MPVYRTYLVDVYTVVLVHEEDGVLREYPDIPVASYVVISCRTAKEVQHQFEADLGDDMIGRRRVLVDQVKPYLESSVSEFN